MSRHYVELEIDADVSHYRKSSESEVELEYTVRVVITNPDSRETLVSLPKEIESEVRLLIEDEVIEEMDELRKHQED